jgi:flagellar biosynthesis protein FlhG
MKDFYDSGVGRLDDGPADQADGLRRMFAGQTRRYIAVVANAHVAFTGVALERLTAALALQGRSALLIDASESAPAVPEASALGLAACVERLSPDVSYLPARGLPRRWVDTRGSSARLLEAAADAAPDREVIVVHAEATDLARMFTQRALRPVLLSEDHPDSVVDAYVSMKLLAARRGWMSCDLVLLAASGSPRLPHIAASVARCADRFAGVALCDWAAVDPASDPHSRPDAALGRLVAGQCEVDALPPMPAVWQRRSSPATSTLRGH